MPAYLDAVLAGLATDPDRVALVRGQRRITAGEAFGSAHRMAFALRDLGARRGGRVAHLVRNTPEAVLARLGTQLAGACYAGLHPKFGAREHADTLTRLAPDVVVADPSLADRAAEALARADVPARMAVLGSAGFTVESSRHEPEFRCPAGPDDLALITFTSGSTGPAKGVPHTHAHAAEFHAAGRVLLGTGPRRYLTTMPLSVLSGENVYWALAEGGSAVLHDHHDPDEVVRAVRDHGVTHIFEVLDNHARMWRHPEFPAGGGSLRQLAYGGLRTPRPLIEEALRHLDCDLLQTYGLWETGFITALSPAAHRTGDPDVLGSAGTPVPGVRVEVRDDAGDRLPPGEIGQVWVHHPARLTAYWGGEPIGTDGWLRTGDLGSVDGYGYLTLTGREDDSANVAGYVVHPAQVEDLLRTHPSVREAAVLAAPGPAGEQLHAVVVADPPVPAAELQELVRRELSPIHRPTTVEFRAALPRTPSGKPDKQRLRPADPSD